MSNPRGTSKQRPPGFLPMQTNLFDRVFIGVVILVAIHLLWLRFVEAFLPLYVAMLISVAIGVVIVRWG
jgi:predicted small integral membrane protein